MSVIWWTSVSIEIFLCSLTATTAHLLMSLGQTLFHRYLGHRRIGGRFFENHLSNHHRHYSGDHVVSENYLNEEANNTPFFLIPVTLVITLGYLVLPLDLFIAQITAMSISFFVHLYFDKHYHVAGSWLGRFAWFRRKQQLHFLHHQYADCNFAVVDNFWDWLLGTYRSSATDRLSGDDWFV
jgi:sterol desaturase/sphingolipid hydroxylase (fatty acid hydroxylase superfamily)